MLRANTLHIVLCASSAALGARHCPNTNQKYSPCLKEHMVLKDPQSIGGQNASFLTCLQFLLLLTGLFVLVALYPSLPVGTLPFPFPGFLFLYFFLKMLPTCLALCALLSILPVLFGTDIPTRLRSGRTKVMDCFVRPALSWSWCAFSTLLSRGQMQTGPGALWDLEKNTCLRINIFNFMGFALCSCPCGGRPDHQWAGWVH